MSVRKVLFWAHLAAGSAAGLVIFIMAVTGVLLAFQRQIIGWADHGYRSAPVAGSQRLPVAEILRAANPGNGSRPSTVTLRSDAAAPAEVSFGRESVLLIDVYSGAVLGESAPRVRAFFQNVENLHRWLGQPGEQRAAGRAITGASNLAFLVLVCSGPFLWMPRKWSFRRRGSPPIWLFRRGLSGRAREFNWHNVIGIWCALPLLVIVASGVVMSYPWANNLVYRITGNDPPVQNAGARPESQRPQSAGGGHGKAGRNHAGPTYAGLDALWARAVQQVPGWRSITARLGPSTRGPVTFAIDTGEGGRPDRRSQLTLDGATGQVIRWEPFSSYNAGRRLRGWLRFLHTGEAGGVAGQTVAGVASAGAAVLVWTGLWLAGRRFAQWAKRRRNAVSLPNRDRAAV